MASGSEILKTVLVRKELKCKKATKLHLKYFLKMRIRIFWTSSSQVKLISSSFHSKALKKYYSQARDGDILRKDRINY